MARGPHFEYFVNASMTPCKKVIWPCKVIWWYYANTNVQISTEGKPYLRAALSMETFAHEFVNNKVQQWAKEVQHLSSIASPRSHAAYSAFT